MDFSITRKASIVLFLFTITMTGHYVVNIESFKISEKKPRGVIHVVINLASVVPPVTIDRLQPWEIM